MEGWIKLYRKIGDNPIWYAEKFSKGQAWIDLLILANHKDNYFYKRGVKINVKRGQVGWSMLALSERWQWSRNKVNKFLKDLEKEHQIEQQKNNVTQIVTILNYYKYQEKEQQKDTKRTPKGHQKDTNKNDKNIKNDKNYIYKLKNFNLSITEDEYNKLLTDYTEEDIKDIFDAIDNDKKTKNKNSLYLTSLNWLKRNNLKEQKFIKHKSFYRNQYKLKVNNNQKKSHELYKQIITIIVNKKDALKKNPLSFKDFEELKQYADNQNINLLRNINDIIASDEIVYKLDLATGIRTYINNNSKAL